MVLLILGVALWWGAHLFKRLAPARRAAMGHKGKGLVALALVASILLMIFGYRMADVPHGAFFWGRHPATVGINNLLMLFALYLTSPGPKKGAPKPQAPKTYTARPEKKADPDSPFAVLAALKDKT